MRVRTCDLLLLAFLSAASSPGAQGSPPNLAHSPPMTTAAIRAWEIAIVARASEMLASRARWNHSDMGRCAPGATSFSINCALQRAVNGAAWPPNGAGGTTTECRLTASGNREEGSCGLLFDEM